MKTAGYRVEGTGYSGEEQIYSAAFGLTEGIRTLSYYAKDNVDNTEVFKSTQVYVDNTAPVTSFDISGPLYIKDGARYITPASELVFTAADPLVSGVSAGVDRIDVSVDGGAYVKYAAALKFAEGRHTIKYRAIDNVGNLEAEHTLQVQSDNTAPETGYRVEGIGYSGEEQIYSKLFGLTEGIRTLSYYAKDNVGNAEIMKSTVIYVDGTAPVSALSLSGDQYKGDKQYISPRTDIVITAADPVVNGVASGVRETKYAVDGSAFNDYSLFKLSAEGRRVVSFYSAD
ncbi:MAG: hypothetical protein HY796_02995, partial [Elusimicrobia bacterium]|nr:hypothetical protein [Elusimicrobiota bacterium]